MPTYPQSSSSAVFSKETTVVTMVDIKTEHNGSNNTTKFQRDEFKSKVSPRKGSVNGNNGTNKADMINFKRKSFTSGSLHRSVFKSKNNLGQWPSKGTATQKNIQLKLRDKFASPTDTLLSPCSQKLNDHKTKFLLTKSNPTKLAFGESKKVDSDESMLNFLSDY
ncbi:similar to Saccharomyces cerevisiae YHR152W SPO12 Nucleolar protein of unknown function, positive regulator of mitotic exit [Maudiozyma barnettii]|uniref:Uncharacterized protein n=1 Tax=Maudiozyma barnettii TaxID=61262 RepID=A0A8H2ZK70_9SACH|nr:Spo12p [Kazachstania barnettii]CAB4254887.1 similar to Saccharomyces cerevisiae YHR152W SPO12 Nucleolar protein of unknown function, positive regulator of mitotic exit [Kazachstania barnettii]CAD1783135.1 similar to Saccharomyces cerevisiae YHR152W SPO12 Nucleolar protein of unknown function, positive regulator of mitotic exit [Kazachstania barnettii]